MSTHRLYDLDARLNEIKRIWRAGLSASVIGAMCDVEIFGRRPTRNMIIGLFMRHPEQLLPCFLTAPNHRRKNSMKNKPALPVSSKRKGDQIKLVSVGAEKKKRQEEYREIHEAAVAAAEKISKATPEDKVRRYMLEQKMLFSDNPHLRAERAAAKSRITLATPSNPILRKFLDE